MRIATVLIFFGFLGCISPLEFPVEQRGDFLVVDGFITDDFGPHTIRLSRMARFSGTTDEGGNILQVDDAQVTVIDNLGNVTPVEQQIIIEEEIVTLPTPFGTIQDTVENMIKTVYTTPENFKGEIGRSYQLQIRLSDGATYESTPQAILAGPELDSVFFEWMKLPSADPVTFRSGIQVYSRWQDIPNERNFYLWTANRGTYLLNTRPDLYIDPQFSTPAPKDCCAVCYISENLNEINLFSDERGDGQILISPSAFIEDDGRRLKDRYHLQVNMFTVSKEAFAFHRLLQSQLSIEGSVLDPPPAEITGNISRLSQTDETVIGFFGAYHVSGKRIFINGSDLVEPQRQSLLPDDCRTVGGSSTSVPPFWNN